MNEKILKLLKTNAKYLVLIMVGIIILLVPTSGETGRKKDVESELKTILNMVEGVGDIDVMISFDAEGRASGAIIVADGAESPAIKKMLQDAGVSVLNLPEYKVQILTKKK